MKHRTIPVPVAATLIAFIVVLAGFFIYRGVAGGFAGDGREGNVQASPPMPETAKQQMLKQSQTPVR